MTATTYKEINFEDHIEASLLAKGYNKRLSDEYDKDLCLIPEELLSFVKSSQPDEYKQLELQYGTDTDSKLVRRISNEISKHGTLQVLRRGVKDRGVKIELAYFKPSSGMNPEHQNLYSQNRFTIVRQLEYSKRTTQTIDVALFLNGIPIITAELKNTLTGQKVEHAIEQYKKNRDPREPLLQFKRCLVHFAIGNEEAYMTTRLEGDKTYFLPFNKDFPNPVNPEGHKTAYLWDDILLPDTLLDLINSYLHLQKVTSKSYDKEKDKIVTKESEVFIFPRFHQLDVVRKLLEAVREEGAGNSYLVQHSAGSGKSNSIAWTAHQLASFYRSETDTERLFDSIIVVTDRTVLDRQLQNTIKQFEQVQGVVSPIDMNSKQLRAALETGKDIIITTIQKFPVISKEMSALKGSRFAVILDEAHSSQSGESAKHLKMALSANLEQAEVADADDFDLEDEVLNELRTRGKQSHISYFGFTATPKNKTLELFGVKNPDGTFSPFHSYSMKQAIGEGFILDVLENYTTYARYFKLIKSIEDDEEYEKKKASRVLMSYVDLQPHAIETKAGIMLDHFLDKTVRAIQGKGSAMVVTRSRLHAVRYYQVFKRLMAERKLGIKPLVAFSGTVKDPDTSDEYTESNLNKLPTRVSIQDAFKTPEYRILIVAQKFQTGFDEPLLHTMYVDKKLGGVHAVQTLSRLNRTMKGKNETFVLDFVNSAEEIQTAFQPYYQTTILEEESDPNKLYDLEQQLMDAGIFDKTDVEEFAKIFFNKNEKGEKLQPILDAVKLRYDGKDVSEREDFKSAAQSFVRLYGFISQVATFTDIGLEKLYVFIKSLYSKLKDPKSKLPTEILQAIDLDSFKIQKTYEGNVRLTDEDGLVGGFHQDPGQFVAAEKDLLSNIIKTLNETYGVELTDEDKLDLEKIIDKVQGNEDLRMTLRSDNSRDAIKYKFDEVVNDTLQEFVNTKFDLYKKLTDPKVFEQLKDKWFREFYKGVEG